MRSFLDHFRFFFREGRPSLRSLGFLPLLSFASGILDGIGVALIVPLLAVIANEQAAGAAAPIFGWVELAFSQVGLPYTPLGLIAVIFGLVLLKQALYYVVRSQGVRMLYDTARNLRVGLMRRLLHAPLSFHDRHNSGELTNLVERESQNVGSMLFACLEGVRTLAMVAIYLATLLIISVKMTVFALGALALLILTSRTQVVRAMGYSRSLVGISSEFRSTAQELISGVQTVRSFGKERYMAERFAKIARRVAETTYRQKMGSTYVRMIVDPVMMACLLATIYVGAVLLALPFTIFVGFVAVLARLSLVAMEGNQSWVDIATNYQSLRAVKSAYDEAAGPEGCVGRAKGAVPFATALEMRGVSFRYADAPSDALDGVSLTVGKGETLGIAGRSGAGKSTLIQVLTGQRLPSSGELLCDGKPVGQSNTDAYRGLFSFISQDVFLFRGTVFENIALGVANPEGADPRAVEDAARKAHAAEFIEALPGKYDFDVSERGGNLSGGQRQRLAIARALLSDTPVLVFDEGTSALDPVSEQHIIAAIRELSGQRTILVVAHKLAMIEQCDRVAVLDRGRVVETGTRAVLLSQPSKLAELFDRVPAMEGIHAT